MTRAEREKVIDKIMGYLATYLSVEQYAEAEKIIKELRQDTVSRESYDHEYFLRKELDLKVTRLERQIAEQEPCEDCISRADALRVAKNEYLRGWHEALCKALSEKYSIHCEEGNFNVIQEETITGLGLSMDCAAGKDVESYMSTIPSVVPTTKWISVSERLPEEDQVVLGTDIYNCFYNTYTWDDCGEIKWYADGNYDVPIVAWIPLPKPYKEEKESEE